MKTTVKTVTVEFTENGHRFFRVYSIATGNGTLMTKRLKKLLDGNVILSYSEKRDALYGDWRDIHFIGVVWHPPYQLLAEIVQNRKELQRELFNMEGDSELAEEHPTLEVPMKESSSKISELTKAELDLRKRIKARLNELDQIKTTKDVKAAKDQDDDFYRVALPHVPTPYSW